MAVLLPVVIVLWGLASVGDAQDSFDTLRTDVRTGNARSTPVPCESAPASSPSSSSSSSTSNFSNGTDSVEDPAEQLGAALFMAVLAFPFEFPRAIAADDYAVRGRFPRFPYDDGIAGSMLMGQHEYEPKRSHALRVRTEYGTDFSGGQREGLQFLYDNEFRLGIDADTNYRHQMRGPASRDYVWTGDTNLLFRFAQCEGGQMRAGLGANWLADDVSTDFGFNFTYGGDFFLAKPWVLSAEIDAGTLGHAGLFHFRTSVGAILRRYEVYTGYDYYDVGRYQTQGLIAGLRFWF